VRQTGPRVSTLPRQRPARQRAESRYLPPERVMGMLLLLVGLAAAAALTIAFVQVLGS
jgi:hypothetical protein